VLDVDHEKICSGARRHPPEIIAAKRAGAADRGGRKDIGCTDRVRLARGHSRVDLERQPALARRRGAVAQQRFGAGVDLGGIKHPVETAGRVLARPVDQPKRAVESIPSGLFVPGVTHLVAIRREPPPERNIGAT